MENTKIRDGIVNRITIDEVLSEDSIRILISPILTKNNNFKEPIDDELRFWGEELEVIIEPDNYFEIMSIPKNQREKYPFSLFSEGQVFLSGGFNIITDDNGILRGFQINPEYNNFENISYLSKENVKILYNKTLDPGANLQDDIIKISGQRLSTSAIELVIMSHPKVADSAVVSYPDPVKGKSIYAFVTLKSGIDKTKDLKREIVQKIRSEIGPIATPEVIQWADALPKTRSGQIMKRILKKIAAGEFDKSMGDTSTLVDPSVVEKIIRYKNAQGE